MFMYTPCSTLLYPSPFSNNSFEVAFPSTGTSNHSLHPVKAKTIVMAVAIYVIPFIIVFFNLSVNNLHATLSYMCVHKDKKVLALPLLYSNGLSRRH